MERRCEFYKIINKRDAYGLGDNFENGESALTYINDSYNRALSRGYDNRNEKWLIVCVQISTEFDENGDFLKRTTEEFVMDAVEYSEYDGQFVIVVN